MKNARREYRGPLWGAWGAVATSSLAVAGSFSETPLVESPIPLACGGFAWGAVLALYLEWRENR